MRVPPGSLLPASMATPTTIRAVPQGVAPAVIPASRPAAANPAAANPAAANPAAVNPAGPPAAAAVNPAGPPAAAVTPAAAIPWEALADASAPPGQEPSPSTVRSGRAALQVQPLVVDRCGVPT
jgi:hypothetical protein